VIALLVVDFCELVHSLHDIVLDPFSILQLLGWQFPLCRYPLVKNVLQFQ